LNAGLVQGSASICFKAGSIALFEKKGMKKTGQASPTGFLRNAV
jgi:hypothetical protein